MEEPDINSAVFKHPALTMNEWIVLEKLVQGVKPVQIAIELGINNGWVRHRFSFLRQKYDCQDISTVKRLVQSKGMPARPKGSDA